MQKNIIPVGAYNYKHQLADLTGCPCISSPHRIKFQYFHCFDFILRLPFIGPRCAPVSEKVGRSTTPPLPPPLGKEKLRRSSDFGKMIEIWQKVLENLTHLQL